MKKLDEIKQECNKNREAHALEGAYRVHQPILIDNTPPRSNRPIDTSDNIPSDQSRTSTFAVPPFKTYLTFTSEVLRHGNDNKQQDLMGIDTKLSTPPQHAIRPPPSTELSTTCGDLATEETPLLQGSDFPNKSDVVTGTSNIGELDMTLEVEQGANGDGNSWQDDHDTSEVSGVSQESTQVEETFMDLERDCKGKSHSEDETTGRTKFFKAWMERLLFPCIIHRRENRTA